MQELSAIELNEVAGGNPLTIFVVVSVVRAVLLAVTTDGEQVLNSRMDQMGKLT